MHYPFYLVAIFLFFSHAPEILSNLLHFQLLLTTVKPVFRGGPLLCGQFHLSQFFPPHICCKKETVLLADADSLIMTSSVLFFIKNLYLVDTSQVPEDLRL